MAEVLNRNGYRLRRVVKAKPQKNFRKPEFDVRRERRCDPSG